MTIIIIGMSFLFSPFLMSLRKLEFMDFAEYKSMLTYLGNTILMLYFTSIFIFVVVVVCHYPILVLVFCCAYHKRQWLIYTHTLSHKIHSSISFELGALTKASPGGNNSSTLSQQLILPHMVKLSSIESPNDSNKG